jgi:hypothetical protein
MCVEEFRAFLTSLVLIMLCGSQIMKKKLIGIYNSLSNGHLDFTKKENTMVYQNFEG